MGVLLAVENLDDRNPIEQRLVVWQLGAGKFDQGRIEVRRIHRGIDLDANRGDPVAAAAAGRVRRVRLSNRGYGNMIHLQHDDGYETLYAPLQSVHVKKDQHIRAGQVIGRAGSSGHSTGPHLHYEVRRNGAHVDPREYLAL